MITLDLRCLHCSARSGSNRGSQRSSEVASGGDSHGGARTGRPPASALARLAFAAALVRAALPASADDIGATPPRTPVRDARPVLLAALAATDGKAHGVLVGELADAITRRFAAISPIFIDVATQRRYQQPGCARLTVVFWQDGVKLPDVASPRRQTMEFGLNYCLDGLPPKSLR